MTTIISPKANAKAYWLPTTFWATDSVAPITSPPATAPRMLPIPPRTAAANAITPG